MLCYFTYILTPFGYLPYKMNAFDTPLKRRSTVPIYCGADRDIPEYLRFPPEVIWMICPNLDWDSLKAMKAFPYPWNHIAFHLQLSKTPIELRSNLRIKRKLFKYFD